MFLGHETRKHADMDVADPRRDQQPFRRSAPEVGRADRAQRGAHPPEAARRSPKPEHHQLWARETKDGPWRMEVFLEQSEGTRWAYRRDAHIGLGVADLGRRDATASSSSARRSCCCTNRSRRGRSTRRIFSTRCRASTPPTGLALRGAVARRSEASLAGPPEMKEARLSAGPSSAVRSAVRRIDGMLKAGPARSRSCSTRACRRAAGKARAPRCHSCCKWP